MKNIINLIVKDYEKGQRVDRFISNNKKDLSRTRIKNLIINKKLKINNETIDNPAKKINTNDNIEIEIPKAKKVSLKPYNLKLDIAYDLHEGDIQNTKTEDHHPRRHPLPTSLALISFSHCLKLPGSFILEKKHP
mgnify:CR=1 FL=1